MKSPTIDFVVAPWLIESQWLWLWVPIHIRRLRKQCKLGAVFGSGYFDMMQPQSEYRWLLVFGLYHLPLMLAGFAIPTSVRIRLPWLAYGLAMLGTPILYSAVALWLG